MNRSHLRTLTITVAAAAFGATLVFTVSPSVATAKEPRAAPRTKIGAVDVDAKLVRTDTGWAIDVEATNPTDSEQPCQLTLALTRFVNSPFSRVRAMPRREWEHAVALDVPANGRVQRRVELPANLSSGVSAAVEVKPAKGTDDDVAAPMATAVEYAVVVSPGAVRAPDQAVQAVRANVAPVRLANAAP